MATLDLYNKFRAVPEEAKKEIVGGKLKGFTDINPMWRIKMLTEEFGECGFGWYYDEVDRWKEGIENDIVCFMKIHLFVKRNDQWSAPIVGIGGSKLITPVNNGSRIDVSDEAYKMALTDAISIACKALGMAADVYFAKDRTKYDMAESQPAPRNVGQAKQQPQAAQPRTISIDTLNKLIVGQAQNKSTKSGRTCRQAYIQDYAPTPEMVAAFDAAVKDYKTANNLA